MLLVRSIFPLTCRFLLQVYIYQKLRVGGVKTYSNDFDVNNGVREGGVISPILFCIYVGNLITELNLSHVECYLRGVLHIKYSLNIMLPICVKM